MLNPFRSKPQTAVIDNPRLTVHSKQPYNAEPPTDQLRGHFLMSPAGFYVRSHGEIPLLDPASHRLRVTSRVMPLDVV